MKEKTRSRKRTPLERERRRVGKSQGQLAMESGVSQSTISRIERGIYDPGLDVFAKLARAIEVPVSDIAPEAIGRLSDPDGEAFFAFCPNLVCDSNTLAEVENGVGVIWKSYAQYPAGIFDEVNFCTSCGEELIKECPSCTRRLQRGARFCQACGTRIVQPTKKEWEAARERYEALKAKKDEDDIPF